MMDIMEDKSLCGLIKFHSARLAEVAKDTEELQANIDNEVAKAYQQGLEEGKKATWEAVRKVIHLPEGVVLDLFTDCYSSVCTVLQVFLKYEGSEVIEKLKAYEEKAVDEIKVGDEVVGTAGHRGFVTKPINSESVYVVWEDGSCGANDLMDLKKTGRTRYDIEKLLEALKA